MWLNSLTSHSPALLQRSQMLNSTANRRTQEPLSRVLVSTNSRQVGFSRQLGFSCGAIRPSHSLGDLWSNRRDWNFAKSGKLAAMEASDVICPLL